MSFQKAVFLDRDGTLMEDTHYPKDPNKVKLLAGVAEALHHLSNLNYLLIVVSNQSGVGRGIITEAQFQSVHDRFEELMQAEKIKIQKYVYCFHAPEEECQCRKPATGGIPKVWNGKPLSWPECFVVGDRESDLQLATNMGARGILVLTGKGEETLLELGKVTFPSFANLLSFAKSLDK